MPRAVGEDIRDVYPRKWADTARVKDNIDIEQSSHSLARLRRVRSFRIRWVCLQECTDDVEERAHSEERGEQGPFTTGLIDEEEDEQGSGDQLDDSVDT